MVAGSTHEKTPFVLHAISHVLHDEWWCGASTIAIIANAVMISHLTTSCLDITALSVALHYQTPQLQSALLGIAG